MFPPLENVLVLLEHINQHLEKGLGLRQILDWALYVDKALDDDTWEHTFAPVVHRLGLDRLAITVTRMCQLYLGLRPDITWCASADEKVCDSLMKGLMQDVKKTRTKDALMEELGVKRIKKGTATRDGVMY